MIDDIHIRLSGGVTNTSSAQSLGGAMSNTRVRSQSVTGIDVTGINFVYAHSNALGYGVFHYEPPSTLRWKTSGDTSGVGVEALSSGVVHLKSGNGVSTLSLQVNPAQLPAAQQSKTVTIGVYPNEIFDDINGVESYVGDIEYRCVYFLNTAQSDVLLNVWIKSLPIAGDVLAIGFDSGGVGATAVTIANEAQAPLGVFFVSPTAEVDGITATLGTGQFIALWLRRSISAAQRQSQSKNYSTIGYSVIG
jgi:hypothetical protein